MFIPVSCLCDDCLTIQRNTFHRCEGESHDRQCDVTTKTFLSIYQIWRSNIIAPRQVSEWSQPFGIRIQPKTDLAGDENVRQQNGNSHASLNNRYITRSSSLSLYRITVLQFKTQSRRLSLH